MPELLNSMRWLLTKQCLPVNLCQQKKSANTVADNAALGDRLDMVFSGTTVVRGTGKAVVCDTAMNTELGKIAKALAETKTPKTSFEVEVDNLSKQITMVIVVLVILAGALMYLHHNNSISEIAIFSLSLGVGAIPESLPVVLSFALLWVHSRCLSAKPWHDPLGYCRVTRFS